MIGFTNVALCFNSSLIEFALRPRCKLSQRRRSKLFYRIFSVTPLFIASVGNLKNVDWHVYYKVLTFLSYNTSDDVSLFLSFSLAEKGCNGDVQSLSF